MSCPLFSLLRCPPQPLHSPRAAKAWTRSSCRSCRSGKLACPTRHRLISNLDAPLAAPRARKAKAPTTGEVQPAKAVFGTWKTECLEKAAKPNCQVIVRSAVGDQIALVLGIARTAKGGVRMQMAVPLGLAIEKGVTIKVGGYSSAFPISRCTAQGCIVEGEVPQPFIDALQIRCRTVPPSSILRMAKPSNCRCRQSPLPRLTHRSAPPTDRVPGPHGQ